MQQDQMKAWWMVWEGSRLKFTLWSGNNLNLDSCRSWEGWGIEKWLLLADNVDGWHLTLKVSPFLEAIWSSIAHSSKMEIHLKIGGDNGGESFKMSFKVANVENINWKDNTVVFSIFEAKDYCHYQAWSNKGASRIRMAVSKYFLT